MHRHVVSAENIKHAEDILEQHPLTNLQERALETVIRFAKRERAKRLAESSIERARVGSHADGLPPSQSQTEADAGKHHT